MQNTIFISCHASSWGGGLRFICYQSFTDKDHKFFYYCYFSGNDGSTGDDISFYLENVKYEKGPFETSFSSSSTKEKRVNWEGKGCQSEWLPDGTLNRYVKSTGTDKDGCGIKEDSNESKCKTINYSIGLIKDFGGWWINLLDNVVEESSITIEKDLFVKVSGNTKEITLTKRIFSEPLFKVSGSFLVSSLTFAMKNASLFNVLSTSYVELMNLVVKCL